MKRLARLLTLTAVAFCGLTATAMAEETDITIRVMSKDAKFIGSSMGGMQVTLTDVHTGETLARGITRGGTGDTALLMHDDGGRRHQMASEGAASFDTTLDLERARLVEATVYGPMAQEQSAHTASATQWVIPGGHLSAGDGWIIELPGFVVDVLEPGAAGKYDSADTNSVPIQANVMMMCGCPIEPDGIWDANDYEVGMTVRRDGEVVVEQAMEYAGSASQFEGSIPVDGPGVYEVTVHAYDPANGNTGVDRTTLSVQ